MDDSGIEAPNKIRFHVFSEILIVTFNFKKGVDFEIRGIILGTF